MYRGSFYVFTNVLGLSQAHDLPYCVYVVISLSKCLSALC